MLTLKITWIIGALLFFFVNGANGETTLPGDQGYPSQVALIQRDSGWTYVHFPTNLRLYTYDLDEDRKSACNAGCASAWPPLIAPGDAKPIGDWTPFLREDGRKQWAYKGQPVYLRYHDSPTAPVGDDDDGLWHFLEP